MAGIPARTHDYMDVPNPDASARTGIAIYRLILAAVAAGFFWLNVLMPRFADDFCRYAPTFSLAEVIRQVAHDYLAWTGRLPVMFILHTLFSLDTAGLILLDLANAACLALVCTLAVRHALAPDPAATQGAQVPALGFCLFLLWFTPAGFAEVALWKTGAVQYLWGCALALFAIGVVIDRVIWQRRIAATRPRTAGFCVLCFIAGAWLENLAVAVLLAWLLFMAIDYLRRREIDRLLAAGLVGWGAGTVLLVVAPGNYVRVDRIGYSAGLVERATTTISHLFAYLDKGLALIYILFCLVLLLTDHPDARRKLYMSLAFAVTGALSVLAMAGAPEISFLPRTAFPFQFMMIMATMSLFPDHLFASRSGRAFAVLVRGLSALLAFALAADFTMTLALYNGVHRQVALRERILQDARSAHETTGIRLPALSFGDRYSTLNGSINFGRYFARDITPDAGNWRNACFAGAHRVNSVVLARPDRTRGSSAGGN